MNNPEMRGDQYDQLRMMAAKLKAQMEVDPSVTSYSIDEDGKESFGNSSAVNMMGGGMSNYDDVVTDEIHNAITVDETNKEVDKCKAEATAFTESVLPTQSARELIERVDEIHDNYDMSDVDAEIARTESMTLLELVAYKKNIDKTLSQWKACAAMLKGIRDIRIDDESNRQIMSINALNEYDFGDLDPEKFDEEYEDIKPKLEKLAEYLADKITSRKSELGSTSAMTTEMIATIDHKLSQLSKESMNYQYYSTRMNRIRGIFQNRLDLEFLVKKFDNFTARSVKDIRRILRSDIPKLNANQPTDTIKSFIKYFDKATVSALSDALIHVFGSQIAAYVFMVFLLKIVEGDVKTGNDVWAKVFIMNVADHAANIFDIGDYNEYMTTFAANFSNPMTLFMSKVITKDMIRKV